LSNDEFKLEPIDTPLPFGDPSPVDKAPAARCESCGGPAEDGDLCAACKRAFEGVLKQVDEAPEPLPVPTMAANEPAVHQPTSAVELEALFDQLAVAPPPPAAVEQSSAFETALIVEEPVVAEVHVAPAPVAANEATIDVRPEIVEEPAVVTTPAVAAMPAIVEEPAPPPAPVEAAAPKPAPVVVPAVPAAAHAPVAPRRGLRTLGAVAAAAIVIATIGIPLSKLWLSRQKFVVVHQQKLQ
jgi:hypothetical protein